MQSLTVRLNNMNDSHIKQHEKSSPPVRPSRLTFLRKKNIFIVCPSNLWIWEEGPCFSVHG